MSAAAQLQLVDQLVDAAAGGGARRGRRRPPEWWRAVPAGCRPAGSQTAWLAAVDVAIDAAGLRVDAAGHARAVGAVVAGWAQWRLPMLSRPTWEQTAAATGLSRRSVARWVRWLRDAGLLGVVETGTTPAVRPMALSHVEGNRAAVYLLTVPQPAAAGGQVARPAGGGLGNHRGDVVDPVVDAADIAAGGSVETTGTPPGSQLCWEPAKPLRGREDTNRSSLRSPGSTSNATTTGGWAAPRPGSRRHRRYTVAQTLLERAPTVLGGLSVPHLASLLRPYVDAGWTASDVLWALDHLPDGRPHWHTAGVRHPAGWLTHRLQPWHTTATPAAASQAGSGPSAPPPAGSSTTRSSTTGSSTAAVPLPPPSAARDAAAAAARRTAAARRSAARRDRQQAAPAAAVPHLAAQAAAELRRATGAAAARPDAPTPPAAGDVDPADQHDDEPQDAERHDHGRSDGAARVAQLGSAARAALASVRPPAPRPTVVRWLLPGRRPRPSGSAPFRRGGA